MKHIYLFIFFFAWTQLIHAQSEWQLKILPQISFGSKNTVQRPNNSEGTRIKLNEQLNRKNNAEFSPRFELEYQYNRHHVIATAALVKDNFEGILDETILYDGTQFDSGKAVKSKYRFNTYRLGYRYRIVEQPSFAFELGATLLLRDAYISMEDNSRKAKFTNVGVAPLLSYYIEWKALGQMSLLSYGDAFAVKVGRAEDIFIGAKYQFNERISATAGYRVLEGGSDADKVYTMALFHFLSVGIGFHF